MSASMLNIHGQPMDPATDVPTDPPVGPGATKVRRLGFALAIAGVVLWSIFAFIVVPSLIRSAHEAKLTGGDGIGFLMKRMEHAKDHPVGWYLGKWYVAGAGLLVAWIGFWFVLLTVTSRKFVRYVVGFATPGAIGAMRAFVCLLAIHLCWNFGIESVANLPPSQRQSMGIMDAVYALGPPSAKLLMKIGVDVDNVPRLIDVARVAQAVCVALLVLGAIGWKTRIVLPIAALLYICLGGVTRSYYWFNHTGLVPGYLLVIFSFMRCNDGFSVDRLTKIWRGEPVPPADVPTRYYAWCRLAIWLGVIIPYVMAGLSKLRNGTLLWWSGTNMQQHLLSDAIREGGETSAINLLFLPSWVFGFLGIMTIITEAGMIFILVHRFFRYMLPIACAGMHLGIMFTMHISFYDLIWIQFLFYDWTWVREWIGRKLNAAGQILVLFDGNCPLCRRSRRVMEALDLFGRLKFVNYRALSGDDLAALNREHGASITTERLEREMVVIKGGREYGGADGYRKIVPSLPALWWSLPLLIIPGLSDTVYRWIAKNRMSLLQNCTDACAIEPAARGFEAQNAQPALATAPPGAAGAATAPPPLWQRLRSPLIVGAIPLLLMGLWSFRTEFYPFTSMQMFSSYTDHTVVYYYRAYNFYEDGTVALARFSDMGQGQPRYSPTIRGGFIEMDMRNGTPEQRKRVTLVRPGVSAGEQKVIDLMKRSGKWWNEHNPGKRIVRMEAVKHQWDFENERKRDFAPHRNDPKFAAVGPPIVAEDIPGEPPVTASAEPGPRVAGQ